MKNEPKFEKMDWYRSNETFNEYCNYYDNQDGVSKESALIKYICKMPLSKNTRRGLIKGIKSVLE